jgi:hypothetical protein
MTDTVEVTFKIMIVLIITIPIVAGFSLFGLWYFDLITELEVFNEYD